MLKKIQKFQNSGIYGQAGGKFFKSLEFFEHYSFVSFEAVKFLGITVFRCLNITKHCNAQQNGTFHSFKAHET